MLTTEELEKLLLMPESDRVERKSSAADRSGIRRAICAFANDLAGHGAPGVIFLGVNDDGSCAGLDINDALLKDLAALKDDGNILPIPSVEVYRQILRDCPVAVIEVHPAANPPVRYQGRVWVRVGPTNRHATPEEETRLAERRRAGDVPFDLRPTSTATVEDLDLHYVQSVYLPAAIPRPVLEENRRSLDQQLRSLHLLVGNSPTWGGLLVCGRDPQAWLPGAYVQFVRFEGTQLTDPIKNQRCLSGRIEDVLRRMDELMEVNICIRTSVTSGPKEVQRPDYPLIALQQLARNAVMHRTYEATNAPIRLYWYADRVVIQNPGGLYGRVNESNIGSGATDYRNPLVAEAMHHLGFAQRFGLGIPLAREALAKNGNPPPQFEFTPTHVTVTIKPAP